MHLLLPSSFSNRKKNIFFNTATFGIILNKKIKISLANYFAAIWTFLGSRRLPTFTVHLLSNAKNFLEFLSWKFSQKFSSSEIP